MHLSYRCNFNTNFFSRRHTSYNSKGINWDDHFHRAIFRMSCNGFWPETTVQSCSSHLVQRIRAAANICFHYQLISSFIDVRFFLKDQSDGIKRLVKSQKSFKLVSHKTNKSCKFSQLRNWTRNYLACYLENIILFRLTLNYNASAHFSKKLLKLFKSAGYSVIYFSVSAVTSRDTLSVTLPPDRVQNMYTHIHFKHTLTCKLSVHNVQMPLCADKIDSQTKIHYISQPVVCELTTYDFSFHH